MADDADGTADSSALRSLVRRGAAWSLVSHTGAQVLRLMSNLLLARLLYPEAFGLMQLVNALLTGLQLFSDIGIGPSIIQSARGADPSFLNTAWTVQVGRGILLWLISCAIALPAAAFYDDPRLAALVAVSGLTALIGGFNSTRLHSMYRDVDLARVSLIDFGSQAAGLLTIVAWALIDPSPWSLVAGGIAGGLVELVLSHTALPGIRNRLHVDRAALAQLIRFGRWIFLSTALTFLVMQSDRLVFGKLVDATTLGLYGLAMTITTAPVLLLGRIESSVFLPVFSRVHNAGQDLQAVYERVRGPWLYVSGWVLAGLCGGGQVAVDLLWDERYAGAGWMTQLLALAAWFGVLELTNGAALLARGEARWVAAGNAGKLAGMVLLIPLGFHYDGFRGAVLGIVASEAVRYVVSAAALVRAGLRGWPRDLRLTLWMLATAWLAWQTALYGAREHWPPVATSALVFVVVTLAWSPWLVPVARGLRRREPAASGLAAQPAPAPAGGGPPAGVGFVAIGRNEGERLRRCLESLAGLGPVVYVDSGSTDGSPETARAAGALAVELDLSAPFTAARARNLGLERLLAAHPATELVQFVDGDCELRPGWVEAGVAALRAHPDVAVACGRRRERRPEASVYNRLCDVEWDTPVGEARACGGDALMRVEALAAVGGYDPSLIAGEEPELCLRLRRRGWRILRLPVEMTWHDADMTRWTQWWKRSLRDGHTTAEFLARYGPRAEHGRLRRALSALGWAVVLPATCLLLLAWALAQPGGPPAGLAVAPALLYLLLAARVARGRRRAGRNAADARAYAVSCVLAKWPHTAGMLVYVWRRGFGRAPQLIEYKDAPARSLPPRR